MTFALRDRKVLNRIKSSVIFFNTNISNNSTTSTNSCQETGLYYYGARYLDPRTSRWISTDPAMGEYIPQAPVNDSARRYNENLPGVGGIFNYVNFHVYHYGGNNPIRYIDPNGMWIDNEDGTFTAEQGDTLWGLFGSEWQEKSGFTRDPKTLQEGETIGIKDDLSFSNSESSKSNDSQANGNVPNSYDT